MLQKEDGSSVIDAEELEGLVIGFYQTLFTASDYFESFFILGCFPRHNIVRLIASILQ